MRGERKIFVLRVTSLSTPKSDFPYIQLRGRWLEIAGFDPGSLVKVRVKKNKIVLEKLNHAGL